MAPYLDTLLGGVSFFKPHSFLKKVAQVTKIHQVKKLRGGGVVSYFLATLYNVQMAAGLDSQNYGPISLENLRQVGYGNMEMCPAFNLSLNLLDPQVAHFLKKDIFMPNRRKRMYCQVCITGSCSSSA